MILFLQLVTKKLELSVVQVKKEEVFSGIHRKPILDQEARSPRMEQEGFLLCCKAQQIKTG